MIRRLLVVLGFAMATVPVTATTETFTIHLDNVSETVFVNNPCFGPMLGVLTYDGVLHVTESDGFYHAGIHVRGTSLSMPLDPGIAPFTGRFNESNMIHLNRNNSNQSIVVTQRDRGRTFHITFKVTVTPGGAAMFVENFSCEA